MNEIWICRFTQDINCPPEKCGQLKNGVCGVDSEKCNSEKYIPAAQQTTKPMPKLPDFDVVNEARLSSLDGILGTITKSQLRAAYDLIRQLSA